MSLIARILIGLQGLGSLLVALTLWFATAQMAEALRVAPMGIIGNATVRADMGGLFMGIAVMMIMAAWKQSRMWALGALVLSASAIVGRMIGVALDGSGQGIWPPIAVEAFAIATLLWARSLWRTPA